MAAKAVKTAKAVRTAEATKAAAATRTAPGTKSAAAAIPEPPAALFRAARAARARAHAPYSNFKVGAAVLDERGRVYAGCNVENAAYPQGLCAEASALAAMVLAGGKRARAVAVVAASPLLTTPCGGCRQKIAEFAGPDCAVHVLGPRGMRRTFTLGELLPHGFGAGHVRPAAGQTPPAALRRAAAPTRAAPRRRR